MPPPDLNARLRPLLDYCASNAADFLKERPDLIEGEHIGAVAGRLLRIEVSFEKERVDTDGRGRARERRDKFPFSSGSAVRGARLLNAVRRVEEDRNAQIAHNDERPKIVD